jgi:hypothetical protein
MDSIHLDMMSFMNKQFNGNIVFWQIDIKFKKIENIL